MEDWQKTVAWSDRQNALEAARPPPSRDWRRILRNTAAGALALIIAAAILLSGRYQLTSVQRTGAVFRLDRLTGSVNLCLPRKNNLSELDCSAPADDWVTVPNN